MPQTRDQLSMKYYSFAVSLVVISILEGLKKQCSLFSFGKGSIFQAKRMWIFCKFSLLLFLGISGHLFYSYYNKKC